MNMFKRAQLSLWQQKSKTFILFFLVALLGSLVSGSILANQAIDSTTDNLRLSLPAVGSAKVVEDVELPLDLRLLGRETVHALGEKKWKIVSQELIEVVSVSILGLIVAFSIGHIAAEGLSTSMIRAELAAEPRDENYWPLVGFSQEMTPEEMLEAFSVSLEIETTILFFVVGIGTVFLSTIVPVVYILELNPKDILMKSKIE